MEDRHLAYVIYNDDTNDLIANIYVSDSGEYSTELLSKSKDIPVLFGWPIPGSRPNPESKYILAFLQSRVIPPNRDMLKSILEANHIYEYDWRVLIRLNQGRTVEDHFRVEAEV